jgi:hypothetical protein
MRHASCEDWGAWLSAFPGFVWPPRLQRLHYAATADWLISGSFRSTGLLIFWAGYSGDLFALLMRLAIAE